MREIKFRAWDKRQDKMLLLYHKYFSGNGIMDLSNPFDNSICQAFPDDVELLQFTGLLDKNGKEIYEGDIVAHKFNDDPNGTAKGEVIFKEGMFDVDCIHFNLTYYDNEVIGNIYENKELMEE